MLLFIGIQVIWVIWFSFYYIFKYYLYNFKTFLSMNYKTISIFLYFKQISSKFKWQTLIRKKFWFKILDIFIILLGEFMRNLRNSRSTLPFFSCFDYHTIMSIGKFLVMCISRYIVWNIKNTSSIYIWRFEENYFQFVNYMLYCIMIGIKFI